MPIEKISDRPPIGTEQLLQELGNGVNGFTGSSRVAIGGPLQETLTALQDCEDPAKLLAGFVPQTDFWIMDDAHRVVGIMLVRHRLNERMIQSGGNIGYFVKASERNKGYAKAAVRLAVEFLKSKGVDRALITTQPDNIPSARVAIANGGVLDTPGVHPDSGKATIRYWIQA